MQRIRRIPRFIENFITVFFFLAGFFAAGIYCPRFYPLCLPISENVVSFVRGSAHISDTIKSLKQPSKIMQLALPLRLNNTITENIPEIKKDTPESVRQIVAKPKQEVTITNDSGYEINTGDFLASPPHFSQKPSVLIVHTHTSESYTPSEKYSYIPSDTYRSEDAAFNVTRIGEEFEKVLKTRGISVIHNKTSHDYPSYNGSYKRSLESISEELLNHPDIGIILDIHRDALSDENGYFKMVTDDDTPCAQGMLVVGTDSGGLEHPEWRLNMCLAVQMQKFILDKHPSLMRPIHLRSERFNGHASPGAVIIEVGSCGNTMDEAILCAGRIAEGIADMIDSLSK